MAMSGNSGRSSADEVTRPGGGIEETTVMAEWMASRLIA
jgi:hypothetical protein